MILQSHVMAAIDRQHYMGISPDGAQRIRQVRAQRVRRAAFRSLRAPRVRAMNYKSTPKRPLVPRPERILAMARDHDHDHAHRRGHDHAPIDWREHGVKVIPGSALDPNTAQTPGMSRAAAINRARAGAEKLWAGTVT